MQNPFSKIIQPKDWESWSSEQRSYIVNTQGSDVHSAKYSGKTWEIDRHRPQYQETCPKCHFVYCFYAVPRNWSLSHSADVWNLMQCANVKCKHQFESCL